MISVPTNKRQKIMQLLSQKALSVINAGLSYSREAVQPGILHFSTGNFHRAHQCSYYHDLFVHAAETDDEELFRWGIVGASTRDGSYEKLRPDMEKQDYLYALVETDDDTTNTLVIGSIIDMLPYADDHQPIKDRLQDEDSKVVSMTVTEGGYFLDDSTGEFDKDAEPMKHDAENPDDPQSVFGLIVQALKKRRDNGKKPFTIMSCDNVPQNGAVCKQTTLGLAKLIDEKLADWIDKNVAFPCSMVDRITPAPTDDLRDSVDLDYQDEATIFCEPFRQWVIEDKFCQDKPPLDKVGARFVDDVTPWEEAKLRILNAGHASLCYPAHLLGMEFVDEAMKNDIIPKFLKKVQDTEILPHVPDVPDTDLKDYAETIRKRYSNSKLSDSIARNCENGSDRQPKFIIPTIRDCIKKDGDNACIDGLATVSAMWCKYCMGKTEDGEEFEVSDEKLEELQEAAKKAKDDPAAWLSLESVYGDLGDNKKFQESFKKALQTCMDEGVEAAMKNYVESN